MLERVFVGMTAIEWAAAAAVAAAIVSLINAVIVAFVARFTFQYMQSTKELVEAARMQSASSIRQADASIKMLEIMNIERQQTESFQRAIFTHSIEEVVTALGRYSTLVNSSAKPWHEKDCWLIPGDWETCRAFVSRSAPALLDEMQEVEKAMNEASSVIQGFIRSPDSLWLSSVQRRMQTGLKLASLQNRMNVFGCNALKVGSA